MKKSTKILLILATLWPVVYVILFLGVFFFSIFFGRNEPPILWALIVPLHLLTMLWIMALIAIYMVNVFRNDRVNKDMKVLWAVVIFMGGIVAMPGYWYLYIWRYNVAVSSTTSQKNLAGMSPSSPADQGSHGSRPAEYVPPPQPPNWRG